MKKEELKGAIVEWLVMLAIFGAITLLINTFSYKADFVASIPGILILLGITFVGLILAAIIPAKIPAMIYISIIALVMALPCFGSFADYVFAATNKISTLGLCTVILAYSGVAIGKNYYEFTKMGWKGIVVTLLVIIGTFLGSALVAQVVLKMQGII